MQSKKGREESVLHCPGAQGRGTTRWWRWPPGGPGGRGEGEEAEALEAAREEAELTGRRAGRAPPPPRGGGREGRGGWTSRLRRARGGGPGCRPPPSSAWGWTTPEILSTVESLEEAVGLAWKALLEGSKVDRVSGTRRGETLEVLLLTRPHRGHSWSSPRPWGRNPGPEPPAGAGPRRPEEEAEVARSWQRAKRALSRGPTRGRPRGLPGRER